jgi:hypothetical protein
MEATTLVDPYPAPSWSLTFTTAWDEVTSGLLPCGECEQGFLPCAVG